MSEKPTGPNWKRVTIAVLGLLIIVGEAVLIARDVRFHSEATPLRIDLESFSTRGGGRGQTRHARARFEWQGEKRIENVQLGLFCRPALGPVDALYWPGARARAATPTHAFSGWLREASGARFPLRIDTQLCRNTSIDGLLLIAALAPLWMTWKLFRSRREPRSRSLGSRSLGSRSLG